MVLHLERNGATMDIHPPLFDIKNNTARVVVAKLSEGREAEINVDKHEVDEMIIYLQHIREMLR